MPLRTMTDFARTAAQVAVESIVNAPEGFDADTMHDVLNFGEQQNVSDLYLDMLREVIDTRESI